MFPHPFEAPIEDQRNAYYDQRRADIIHSLDQNGPDADETLFSLPALPTAVARSIADEYLDMNTYYMNRRPAVDADIARPEKIPPEYLIPRYSRVRKTPEGEPPGHVFSALLKPKGPYAVPTTENLHPLLRGPEIHLHRHGLHEWTPEQGGWKGQELDNRRAMLAPLVGPAMGPGKRHERYTEDGKMKMYFYSGNEDEYFPPRPFYGPLSLEERANIQSHSGYGRFNDWVNLSYRLG